MLPQYERLNKTNPIFRISFGSFALTVVSLPFLSFIFCVVWCLIFFFQRSTDTHCKVPNFLPSISAAIGNYEPQRSLWQWAILLHAVPRIFIAVEYLKYHKSVIRKKRHVFVYLTYFLNIVENFALVGLSLWTSVDNYSIHKKCFGTFIFCSEFYMLITYWMNKKFRRGILTKVEKRSLTSKRNLFVSNLLSFGIAGYCFVRHNNYCEPYVYSMFSLFEYFVVLTNMGYHMTAYWDFSHLSLLFDLKNGLYFSNA